MKRISVIVIATIFLSCEPKDPLKRATPTAISINGNRYYKTKRKKCFYVDPGTNKRVYVDKKYCGF